MALFSNVRLYTFIFHFAYALPIPFRFVSDLKECWGLNSWNKLRALLQESGPKHSINLNNTPSWLQASFVTIVAFKFSFFILAVLSLWCAGFSLPWPLGVWSAGSRVHGLRSYSSWARERTLSSCGAHTGLVALQHVGSSCIRD